MCGSEPGIVAGIAPAIAVAGAADMAALAAALAALSVDLGDTHRADAAALAAACLGDPPACHGLLARGAAGVTGAALVSPLFSTTLGAAGAYVSDLWVAGGARGQGLGRRLLQETTAFAAGRWGARFLKLAVYDGNVRARDFYARMGFRPASREHALLLAAPAFAALLGEQP